MLQHILDGDQPGCPPVLIDHDGQVVAVVAKLPQQIVQALALGHKHRWAQQGADVQLGRTLQFEQVFGQQDADDVVALTLVNRKTRMPGVDHLVQQLVHGVFDVEQVHARGRQHHIAGGHVGHADHALEHQTALGVDDLVVLGLGQGLDQLIGRVGSRVDELREFLQKTPLVFALGVARGVRVRHGLGLQDML